MNVKMIVACKDSNGAPTFFKTVMKVSNKEYHNGDHYTIAENLAKDQGYEGDMVAYTHNEFVNAIGVYVPFIS